MTLISRFSSQQDCVGGAENSAILHNKILCELEHQSVLVCNFPVPDSVDKVIRLNIPTNRHLQLLIGAILFPLVLVGKKIDLINPHSRADQIVFSLTKWLHRKPVVWKDPGDLVHQVKLDRKNWLAKINQKLLILAIKKADAIYALNDDDRQTILDRLEKLGQPINPNKIRVIESNILFTDYNLTAKSPKSIKKLVIGTVIRLDQNKGVQYIIEAVKQLSQKYDFEVWVVGDGPYRPGLETMSKSAPNITFWGYQDDISPCLNGIDIFVQPAEFEGWGRNVKEAMYFGKAIVGSNVGGIAKQIEDGKTGLLFEAKNSKQLAEKIELLIKDRKLRERLGKAAQQKALKDGDYVTLVKTKILPLFEEILANYKR